MPAWQLLVGMFVIAVIGILGVFVFFIIPMAIFEWMFGEGRDMRAMRRLRRLYDRLNPVCAPDADCARYVPRPTEAESLVWEVARLAAPGEYARGCSKSLRAFVKEHGSPEKVLAGEQGKRSYRLFALAS